MKPAAKRLLDYLRATGVDHRSIEHPPCRSSAESWAARSQAGYPDAVGAKALIVVPQKGPDFALLVVPGTRRLDSAAVRRVLGRFRFATCQEVVDVSDGLEPGAIPPFAAPVLPGVTTLMADPALQEHPWIGFNAASFTASVIMRSAAYAALPMPVRWIAMTLEGQAQPLDR